MLTGIAMILLLGLLGGWLASKCKLPALLGMMIVGILLSPYALNLIDGSILAISGELRQIALVIILTRAGLSLDISDLKRVGRPAVLMCFVPACAEILGVVLLAPPLLGVSLIEAAIIGSVLAAVSPAVVVPRMLRLLVESYGTEKGIPQLILAGASVDDVFVIVVFTAFTSLAATGELSAVSFCQIPVAILSGVLLGYGVGTISVIFFQRFAPRNSVKILLLFSISFLFLELETRLQNILPLSGLLAIMSVGLVIKQKCGDLASELAAKYNELWVVAEIFLFVLVGATVDLRYVTAAGLPAVCLVLGSLLFRMAGVALSLVKTNLSRRERLFCMVAYTPKATVQAASGAIPLSMGFACGNTVLTVAVLSILITAPLGAVCIDRLYRVCLKQA